MTRGRRILVRILLIVLVLLLATVFSMRLLRHNASAPRTIAPGVVHVRNLFTDIYGVKNGDRILLFDAGVDGDGRALDALVAALGGTRDAVEHVFLTHGHFDHVAESPLCTKASIHVGRADVDLLARRVPVEPRAARWFGYLLPVGPIEASAPFQGPTGIPIGGGREVLALPLPGHTRGSHVYYLDGILFAGDSLQIDGDALEFAMPAFSVDMEANHRGVAGLLAALGGRKVETVCTGHQGCTPPGRAAAMLGALAARARP